MAARWAIQTPTGSVGTIGVIQVWGDSSADVDAALSRLGVGAVAAGAVALRDLCGTDHGLVARWADTSVFLMPHGGSAVMRGLADALMRAGLEHAAADPRTQYPEAGTLLEARMLAALARAASPLAIDLLLDQPRRWAAEDGPAIGRASDPARDSILNRLIDPPLVVAVGPANVGKSSLANALAGRTVAIVADEPGTTRDHVGVLLDLAGLVVRYVDTPGVRPSLDAVYIDAEAAAIAADLASRADLVIRGGDAKSRPPPLDYPVAAGLTVSLRSDLGLPDWPFDHAVSSLTGAGLAELTAAIREALVPQRALDDPAPWRFWND